MKQTVGGIVSIVLYQSEMTLALSLSFLQVKSPRKFTCTICDYETTHKYSLKRHIERHSETRAMPEKVFRCEECGYQTGYKSSLKRHLAKHSDVKPFKCGHCEYSAINMTQMHVHIAKHTGKYRVNPKKN